MSRIIKNKEPNKFITYSLYDIIEISKGDLSKINELQGINNELENYFLNNLGSTMSNYYEQMNNGDIEKGFPMFIINSVNHLYTYSKSHLENQHKK